MSSRSLQYTMDAGRHHGDVLPTLSQYGSVKKEHVDYKHQPLSAPPLASPSTIELGPPPPYSYSSSSTTSAPSGAGMISPPESRRTSGDEKEDRPARQSLPSIQEALGANQVISYPSAVSSQRHPSEPLSAVSPRTAMARANPTSSPYVDQLNFSPVNTRSPYSQSTSAFAPHPSRPALEGPSSQRPETTLPTPRETRFPPLPSLNTTRPPPNLAGAKSASGPSHNSEPNGHVTPRGHATQQPLLAEEEREYNGHNPHWQEEDKSFGSFPRSAHAPPQPPWMTQPPVFDNTDPHGNFAGKREAEKAREAQAIARHKGLNGERYGVSVKRHLDYFDLEASLSEIAESSGRLNEFSRDFKHRAREAQIQRVDYLPDALPTIEECDDMIGHQQRVQDLLLRLKDMLTSQYNAASSQQHDPARRFKGSDYDGDDGGPYNDEPRSNGHGSLGPDVKKRRGRAAPPGRCHSCNRAETPEWRRGPDGARTLCNACGLHYAKLTRKMGAKTQTQTAVQSPSQSSTQTSTQTMTQPMMPHMTPTMTQTMTHPGVQPAMQAPSQPSTQTDGQSSPQHPGSTLRAKYGEAEYAPHLPHPHHRQPPPPPPPSH